MLRVREPALYARLAALTTALSPLLILIIFPLGALASAALVVFVIADVVLLTKEEPFLAASLALVCASKVVFQTYFQ